MSFNEFDMTKYYDVLDEFKKENNDKVIKLLGSIERYDEIISKVKADEDKFVNMAIKQYGSIEKYAETTKKNLNNSLVLAKAEEIEKFKKNSLSDNNTKLTGLYKKLAIDLSKEISSKEIQQIATEITSMAKNNYEVFSSNMGNDYWYSIVQLYLVFPSWIEEVDKKYENGASKFIGGALKLCLGIYEPKLKSLYGKLTADLTKSPLCDEIQGIILEIIDETEKQNAYLKMEIGENYWRYQSEQYFSDFNLIKVMDEKYGIGASKFIGKALNYYIENNDK